MKRFFCAMLTVAASAGAVAQDIPLQFVGKREYSTNPFTWKTRTRSMAMPRIDSSSGR